MTGTPIKLRNGDWGAKVHGRVKKGDTVTIRTKAGKTWSSTVGAVVWSGDGVCLVTTTQKKSKTCSVGGRKYKRASGYCYYPCPVSGRVCSPENGRCHDCM